jgi:hypothetical protein
VEKITADQLQPGTGKTTSIFYPQRANIISFDEFKYFTGVDSIKSKTFEECYNLTSITIPEGVTTIGEKAFAWCEHLDIISYPKSLAKIESNAFYYCGRLKNANITDIASWCSVYMGGTNTNPFGDGGSLYLNNELVTDLVIPEGVTTIGEGAFSYCHSLTSVIIPNSVTKIEAFAFIKCINIISVTIPDSVTTIGNSAFSGCSSLKTFVSKCKNAPVVNPYAFGSSDLYYTGRNTYYTGENMLYVPVGATGYNTGAWLDPLQNAEKCGFTISYSL